MRRAAHALFNLAVVEGQENLVGTVFENQEDLDHYFPSIMKYLNDLSEEDIVSNNEELDITSELLEQTCPCLRCASPSSQPNNLKDAEGLDDAGSDDEWSLLRIFGLQYGFLYIYWYLEHLLSFL